MSAVTAPLGHTSTWQYAAELADLDDGVPAAVDVDRTPVCLVRDGHRIHALLDICSHQDYPLSQGEVSGDTLECCVHGACFDLTTGSALTPPATEPVPVYPVRVCEGEVFVRVTETE
jgi:3-phenylpropionate/trans-cinnamate dioxygenase ferredoxin component